MKWEKNVAVMVKKREYITFLFECQKKRSYCKDLNADGVIILIWILVGQDRLV
jgi:hypothetical protein